MSVNKVTYGFEQVHIAFKEEGSGSPTERSVNSRCR